MKKHFLRLQEQIDYHPQSEIEDSFRGVEYDFFYSGKRQAARSAMIELHITSTVRDWDNNVYIRKAWYMGDKEHWQKCIENHVRQHLLDLSTDSMLVKRMLQDFRVTKNNYKFWGNYASHRIKNLK